MGTTNVYLLGEMHERMWNNLATSKKIGWEVLIRARRRATRLIAVFDNTDVGLKLSYTAQYQLGVNLR